MHGRSQQLERRVGGTSFASPVMAGIQALVNQNVGGPQGNPNYCLLRPGREHSERVP